MPDSSGGAPYAALFRCLGSPGYPIQKSLEQTALANPLMIGAGS